VIIFSGIARNLACGYTMHKIFLIKESFLILSRLGGAKGKIQFYLVEGLPTRGPRAIFCPLEL
jgi:hypothetical protein